MAAPDGSKKNTQDNQSRTPHAATHSPPTQQGTIRLDRAAGQRGIAGSGGVNDRSRARVLKGGIRVHKGQVVGDEPELVGEGDLDEIGDSGGEVWPRAG